MIAEFVTSLARVAQARADCLQGSAGCDTGLPPIGANNASLQTILQIVFGLIGATALVIIIVGAIRLVASQGDPKAVATIRDTIIYASVGLAVALSAEAIVTFVLGNV